MNSPTPRTLRTVLHVGAATAFAFAGTGINAATLTVGNLDDSGAGSLRQAMASASAGDTIVFAPGLSGSIQLGSTLPIDRNLTVLGNTGIVLDGGDAVRVLSVASGVAAHLDGLVFQRGMSSDGGGIFSNGTLTLSDCIVRNNHASDRGGGIFIGAGSYTLVDTQVINNESVAEGGGIVDFSTGASAIVFSDISGNTSSGPGGGIRHVSGLPLSISHSNISGNQIANTATLSGGGISSLNGTLNISYSTISANKAHFAGGIFIQFVSQATLNLTGSLVTGNTAVSDGGGIFVFGGVLNGTNSTIANNLSGAATGGGIAIQNTSAGTAAVSLINSTIAFNRANSNGGGITLISGGLTLKNTLIGGNTASTNPDIQAAFTSQGYNLVQTRGTSVGYLPSDLANGTVPNLANLAFNGGPTNTVSPLAGSPAINAIPGAGCSGIALDQRGYQRPASGCDIGAFEVEGFLLPENIFASGME
jgi:hypothetical protein